MGVTKKSGKFVISGEVGGNGVIFCRKELRKHICQVVRSAVERFSEERPTHALKADARSAGNI